MPISVPALHRIREAPLRPEALAMIFEQIGKMVDQFGAAASVFQLDYQQPSDELEPGDLIPTITLAVRPYVPSPAVPRPVDSVEAPAYPFPATGAD